MLLVIVRQSSFDHCIFDVENMNVTRYKVDYFFSILFVSYYNYKNKLTNQLWKSWYDDSYEKDIGTISSLLLSFYEKKIIDVRLLKNIPIAKCL